MSRVRSYFQRTHVRVATLATAIMIIMVVSMGVVYRGLEQSQLRAERLLRRANPVTGLLLNADRDLYQTQFSLALATAASNRAQQLDYLAGFRENLTQSRERLDEAQRLALHQPGETLVWREYERFRRQWEEHCQAVVEALGVDEAAAAREIVDAEAAFDRMRHQIDRLEEEFYEPTVGTLSEGIRSDLRWVEFEMATTLSFALVLGTMITLFALRTIRSQERILAERSRQRDAERLQRGLETRLHHALEMAKHEAGALSVTREAIAEAVPGQRVELLLADSSQAHLQLAMRDGPGPARASCGVCSPRDCPAVRSGRPLKFVSNRRFDACPHLKSKTGEACSATCIPVSIMGQAVGVLHAPADVGAPPDEHAVEKLTSITTLLSDRLGMIRTFAEREAQAYLDPLTGMMNRRCLEEKLTEIRREDVSLSLAFGDIDRFKRLNDTHGHETGDRALRLLAETIRETLGADDLACRWGGEEFVLVLREREVSAAAQTIERIRTELARRLADATTPAFTASFGVCDLKPGDDFQERLQAADTALTHAKEQGRNRVVVSGHVSGFVAENPETDPAETRSEIAAVE